MSNTSVLTAGRLLSFARPPTLASHHLARSSSTRLQPTLSRASFVLHPSSRRHASSTSRSAATPAGRLPTSTLPPRSKPPNARRTVSAAASSDPSAAASPSPLPTASDSSDVANREPPPSRELEVQDQVLFAIAEQVGGKFGNAVKIVDLGPRVGLQTNRVLSKDMRAKFIRALMTAGVRYVEGGAILDHRLVPQLEETTDVLVKVANLDSKFHLPTYCPDLAALETLCSGIQWDEHERVEWFKGEILCDEITIIVGCSETYSVANFAMPIREHLESLRPVVREATALGFRVRAHLHCAIECPFEGPIPSLRAADLAQELVEMGCYEVALGDTTGRGDPRSVRDLIEDVAVRIGVEKISGQFHDTFGTGMANVLTALSLGVRTFDTCSAGLASCPYSPGAIASIPTEDVVYTLHNLGYSTGINLIELSKSGAWAAHMVDLRHGTRSRAGQAILARIKWEELEEVKQMRRDRFVSWSEWAKENSAVSIGLLVLATGAFAWWNWTKVTEHPVVVERKLQDRLSADMIDQALRRMEKEERTRDSRQV